MITNLVVTQDDGTITIVPGEPKPLGAASGVFTDLIGSALAASQAQVSDLTAQVASLNAQLADMEAQLAQLPTAE